MTQNTNDPSQHQSVDGNSFEEMVTVEEMAIEEEEPRLEPDAWTLMSDASSEDDDLPPLIEEIAEEEEEEEEEAEEVAQEENNPHQLPLFTLRVTYVTPNAASAESAAPTDDTSENNDSVNEQHFEIVFVLSPFDSPSTRNSATSSPTASPSLNSPRLPFAPDLLLRLLLGLSRTRSGTMPFGDGSANFMPMSSFGLDDFMNRAFLQYQQGVRSAPPSKSAIAALDEYEIALNEDGTGLENCTICQEDFIVGERATKLPCAHEYHSDCVMQWLKDHHTCPICRNPLETAEQVDPLSA